MTERSGGAGSSSGNQLFMLQRKRSSSFSGVDESNPNLKVKVRVCAWLCCQTLNGHIAAFKAGSAAPDGAWSAAANQGMAGTLMKEAFT